jgi:hypothetical protein
MIRLPRNAELEKKTYQRRIPARIQRMGVAAAKTISDLPPSDIARYLREHPETAKALVLESYDKRFCPSSFIVEEGSGSLRVGWYSTDIGYECVYVFSDLGNAATD